jgi:hypothetical protein
MNIEHKRGGGGARTKKIKNKTENKLKLHSSKQTTEPLNLGLSSRAIVVNMWPQ